MHPRASEHGALRRCALDASRRGIVARGWRDCPSSAHASSIHDDGADPSSAWLGNSVTLDACAFIKTGADLTQKELAAAGWSLGRQPYMLESSSAGIFAAGDVRSRSVREQGGRGIDVHAYAAGRLTPSPRWTRDATEVRRAADAATGWPGRGAGPPGGHQIRFSERIDRRAATVRWM